MFSDRRSNNGTFAAHPGNAKGKEAFSPCLNALFPFSTPSDSSDHTATTSGRLRNPARPGQGHRGSQEGASQSADRCDSYVDVDDRRPRWWSANGASSFDLDGGSRSDEWPFLLLFNSPPIQDNSHLAIRHISSRGVGDFRWHWNLVAMQTS